MDYLYNLLESINNQEVFFDEILIFDNSVNQNIEIEGVYKNNIKVVRSGEQVKANESWSKAVENTKNDYVAIIGDDDLMLPNFCKKIKEKLISSDVVIARATKIDADGRFLSDMTYPEKNLLKYQELYRHRLIGRCPLFVPGIAFSKDLFKLVGGFKDTGLEGYAFSDELLVLSMAYVKDNIGITDEVCWQYRVHKGQLAGVKSIENLQESSVFFVDQFEEALEKLTSFSSVKYKSWYKSYKYLERVVNYRLTQYANFASRNLGFYEFQKNLFKEIFSKRIISLQGAMKIYYSATRTYLKR